MAMRMGILGKKLGMTQVFAEDGERIPVTVIQTGPNYVVGKRTEERDGYSALVVGFGEKPARLANKPLAGQFKNGVKPPRMQREFRLPADEVAKYEVGQELKISEVFEAGIPLDVTGTSKGKGYQGVMKRHNMSGTKASHGVHEYFRHGGSIGCRLTPGRVHKGKRMSGRMGGERKTVQNLQLVQILEEDNAVLVRGAIPGPNQGYVMLRKAATRAVYKRVGMGVEEARSKNPLKASKKAAAGR
ncbi:50S ribosomal protein L3 [Haliangium ochraceum]|uniref:Large ribosomal subunit protein uL3 n=1 Tax=Haliangium ochraceum (strain DSM 14365 / JCM 11303 / SMP-2) TaxID=502025 RepID=D0LT49_HALO1|nr:50S ribosomal protein L3 [Haliangium ochraceum]ACY19185.1 50S ribosomal protein L3 [Haliangium ochraceum DSM 14365]